ncbi:MAG: GC-type dockerin domain-anchored protein [Phycisphaerales bacterium]
MQRNRTMSVSALAMMAISGLASGDEIRWINPAGGDWNDAANWEPQRVPADFENVVFDLDGNYTVTVCGERPGMWSSLNINNSKVTFDLCGESFISWPYFGDKAKGTLDIGTDAEVPTEVVFMNGVVVDPDGTDGINDFTFTVGKIGQPQTQLFIEDDGGWGQPTQPMKIYIVGESKLYSRGPLTLRGVDMFIGRHAIAEFTADVYLRYSGIYVSGEMHLDAELADIESESEVAGSGVLHLYDGSEMYADTFDLDFVFHGAATRRGYFSSGSQFDLREFAGPGVAVLKTYTARIDGVTVIYGPGNRENTPVFGFSSLHSYTYHWRESQFYYESDEPISPGTSALIGLWESFLYTGEPEDLDVDMFVNAPSPGTGVMRWGPTDSADAFGLYILGVPDNWCPADLDLNGELNFFDIARFIDEYNTGSAWANINNDVRVNEKDIAEFISVFTSGCP